MANRTDQIKELRRLNDELENYFRNTIIPQLYVDANLVLKKFSPPAMKHFKLSLEDQGKSIRDIINNLRFPTIIENIEHVVSTQNILEKEIQTTDFRWFQMNIIPYIIQNDKTVDGVIITFVDITTRIRDLQEQEKLISDHETLLDTLSHDIKTPLTSLTLAIELFRRGAADDPAESNFLLSKIESSISKMKAILYDLTDTREEEHKYKATEELLNIENILEDVRLTLTDEIQTSGARITTDFNVSEIRFVRRKIRSILYNLISNAIKYRSANQAPVIRIHTEQTSKGIILSVTDNGKGIETGQQNAIFEKYFRIENKLEGTGLGLYLVKEIVNSVGGSLEVISEPGKGSSFLISLKNNQ